MVSSEKLAAKYLALYNHLARIQGRIRVPIIIIGSFTGITSFGSETFPRSTQKWINIGVGIVSVCIACVNAIESFLKIGENTNSAMSATIALQRLRENITKELSIPIETRTSNGSIFLRDCYTVYQQILIQAPFMRDEVHYVMSPEMLRMKEVIKQKYPLTIQNEEPKEVKKSLDILTAFKSMYKTRYTEGIQSPHNSHIVNVDQSENVNSL